MYKFRKKTMLQSQLKNIVMAKNEIVKYNNKLNMLAFRGFTEEELKLFFAILSQLRDKGIDSVTLTFDALRELTDSKQHLTLKETSDLLSTMYSKMLNLRFLYDDGEDLAGEFALFHGYERSLKEQTFTIAMSPRFQEMVNDLNKEFTRFELHEFNRLNGKYTKHLYRLLKQFRRLGSRIFTIEDIRQMTDTPEKYSNAEFTRRILDPSVAKLRELASFRDLTYQYQYRKRTITHVKFTWTREMTPEEIKELRLAEAKKKKEDEEARLLAANLWGEDPSKERTITPQLLRVLERIGLDPEHPEEFLDKLSASEDSTDTDDLSDSESNL